MKKWYKIGLFFIGIIIICLMIVILWQRHSYLSQPIQPQLEQYLEPQDVQQKEAGISQTTQVSITTTCDTICLYENIDKKDGTIVYEEIQLPEKYIGMTRQQLEEALTDDVTISLEDKEKGFVSQYLESFSQEKIKIVRMYDTTPETEGFYIMVQDHYICVYEADKQTLYFRSGILLEDLPLSVQEEIMKGKYISTEMEVFHFLESYSS